MAIFSVIDTAVGGDTWYEGMVKVAANWAITETELTNARGGVSTLDTRLDASELEVSNARDGEATLLAKNQAQDTAIAAATAGSGVLVSANDTTLGYLNGKLVVGEGIDFTENDDGGDESLTISCENATVTNKGIASFATAQFTVTAGAVTAKKGTTTVQGTLETATDAEAIAGTATDKAIVPSNLTAVSIPRVIAKTAAYTSVALDYLGNTIVTNLSAGTEVNVTLVAATVGLTLHCEVRTAQYLRCTVDGTETIEHAGTAGSAGGYVRSNEAGTSWTLQCREAGKWSLINRVGIIKADE